MRNSRASALHFAKSEYGAGVEASSKLSVVVPNIQKLITDLNNDLVEECKHGSEESTLTLKLREKLESYCPEIRREVTKKMHNGCAPLFLACKRGCVEIAKYLLKVCDADIEQRGLYDVPEDRTFHYVTPLWCAVVCGKFPVVKYLVRTGCDINGASDSGSTPVRSACFMTHLDIVKYLVEHGADIKRPNMNGGTCLINSVQSIELCKFLIEKGVNVNAKDTQEKTALHYAIQEHRLETTKLLLENGADPYAESCYGDDALRTAVLKGAHQIFDYLKTHLKYTARRIAEAHELIGSTFLDEHNETRVAILHWRLAHHIRASHTPYIEKLPRVPLRPAYGNAVEFTSLEELDNIATDIDAMRIQSLLICERILGIQHKATLFRLMFRGVSYADSLRLQRCIDLWRLLLEVRISHCSLLYTDTCFGAQDLVRLMLDLHHHSSANENATERQRHNIDNVPLFDDVFAVFNLLTGTITEARSLLQIRPVYRKQQENFDRVLRCIVHLIYLLIRTGHTVQQQALVFQSVSDLVRMNVRSACTSDTLLHLSVSRLNVMKSGYFGNDNVKAVFPNGMVIKLLIDCGMDINSKNENKSTPLHVASQPYNYSNEIISLLLENGSDLDLPNRSGERPFNLIINNPANTITVMNFLNLKCLAASVIGKFRIPYKNQIPQFLEDFVKQHEL